MESIIQKKRECLVCHITRGLHRHHVYAGSRRKASEENGFTVWLCGPHHNLSNEGVHFNHELDLLIKQLCQREYEQTHSREEFMKLIGKNYL